MMLEAVLWQAELGADFHAAVEAFLLSRRLKNTSTETILWYRKRLKLFADFCQRRDETPTTFRKDTVLAYLRLRLGQVRPQTVNGDLRAIRAFAHWLYREGLRNDDPTQGIEKLKETNCLPAHAVR